MGAPTQEEFIRDLVNMFGARNESGSKDMTMEEVKVWLEKQNVGYRLIQGEENGREYWMVEEIK